MKPMMQVVTLLVAGLAMGVMLAALVARRVMWRAKPILPPADDASSGDTSTAEASTADAKRLAHDLMTTSDGTRLLLRAGRLVVPGADDLVPRAPGETRPK